MNEVIVVIKDGRVEAVYGDDFEISVELIDLDTQDEDELASLNERLQIVKEEYQEIL